MDSQFQWTSAACTDVGHVRARNEDACLDRPAQALWAVADGMGGHALGDVASQAVVAALAALPAQGPLEDRVGATHAALQAVNQELVDEAARLGVRCIGSTVVVLLATDGRCACVWAGDSRLYRLRGGQLARLTRDHNYAGQLLATGWITEEQARRHPTRNTITRAVGATPALEPEQWLDDVADGDIFLLCSDGLSNEVDDDTIAAVLARHDVAQAAPELVRLALDAGGRDNVSVVVVRAARAG